MDLETQPDEIIYETLIHMHHPEIIQTCKINKRIYNLCSQNPKFIQLLRDKLLEDLEFNYITLNGALREAAKRGNLLLVNFGTY